MTPIEEAPELALYQEAPRQLAVGSPGKVGELNMGFTRRGEKTVLSRLYRRAPLIVQRAIYWDEAMPNLPCVYLISNSGGVLQGDRYRMIIELDADAQAHITTQSATKIQEMDANFATQEQNLSLAENTYLEYLPEPLIPHKRSRFVTRTNVSIHSSATFLYSEILMPGRKYYDQGECFQYDLFSSTVRAQRPEGTELFTERFLIHPLRSDVRSAGVMGQFDVFGNVILLTPKEQADRIFAKVSAELNLKNQLAAGASRLPNEAGLLYKVLGMESQPVRAKIREFWALVRREVTGHEVPPEFAWR
ncbi:MAG: urease accessory protein UreD [Gemmataceae bacterium]